MRSGRQSDNKEDGRMLTYKCIFTVNGVRTVEEVSARSVYDAKKLIQYQYQGCKIVFWSVTRIG